jgi:CubicO group peptidase (beta-lactamase class C family)
MKFSSFVLLFLIPFFPFAQYVNKQIDHIVEEHYSSFPDVGLVVSVSNPDGIVYERASGYADLAFDIKAGTNHKFRIGSITKQFTAVAILKLLEENKLSLTDSIQQFLPDFPYHGHKITIEHLLTHTSGVPEYTYKEDWFPVISKTSKTPLELVEYFMHDPFQFNPGERYAYSNSGYHLLGCIIEKVTQKSYEEYLSSIIFEPLGMENTSCHNSLQILKNFAKGYESRNGAVYNASYVDPQQPFAAGNIVSTTGDLRKWYEGLFNEKIIRAQTLAKALQPFQLNNSQYTHYGYGWELDTIQGMPVIKHNGTIPGYNADVLYFLDSKILVSALSNSMPVTNMVKKIGAAANLKPLEEPEYLNLSLKKLAEFEAAYEGSFGQYLFEVIDNRLYYSSGGGNKFEIKAVEKNKFYSRDWDVFFEFKKFDSSKYQNVVLHWNGEEYEFKKI